MTRRIALVLIAFAVALVGPLAPAPAEAAAAKAKITIKRSAPQVYVNSSVKFTGKVNTAKAKKAVVGLQRYSGGKWKTIKKTRVNSKRSYAFTVKVTSTAKYRARLYKSKKVKGAYSSSVTVAAKKRPAKPVAKPSPTPIPDIVKCKPPTAATVPAAPKPDRADYATERDYVIDYIIFETNEYRASRGCAPVYKMNSLTNVAQAWTAKIATMDSAPIHNPNYFAQYPQAELMAGAENIGWGGTFEKAVPGWIGSYGHRMNLLGDYNYIGVGYVADSSSRYTYYYTQNFAKYNTN